MKPEKRVLIHDLLSDPEDRMRREATLMAGQRLLRHKRWKRGAGRVLAVAMVILAVTVISIRLRPAAPGPALSATPAPTPAVHYLTDDQLLALFPDTPVGLATVGGRKVLLFPRPGDEERFVGRF
jgi:hypothetical protein